jgi:two-component system chemotaxis response regulator CheY
MKKILVVEDRAISRKFSVMFLESAGYKVLQAQNGEEALDRIKEEGLVDLAFIDIIMPRMGGFELARRLRMSVPTCKIPIVFLTVESSQEKIDQGRTIGVAGWMIKPFTPEQLVAVADKFINKEGGQLYNGYARQ